MPSNMLIPLTPYPDARRLRAAPLIHGVSVAQAVYAAAPTPVATCGPKVAGLMQALANAAPKACSAARRGDVAGG